MSTHEKSPGKYGIAVPGFADQQRGTVDDPKAGPFSPTQDPSIVKTAEEHEAIERANADPEGSHERR